MEDGDAVLVNRYRNVFVVNNSDKMITLQWRHSGHNCASNHQPHHCLLNRVFRRRSKKTSKLRATGLCAWNSTVTGEFPPQPGNAENVSFWLRHHVYELGHAYIYKFCKKNKKNISTGYIFALMDRHPCQLCLRKHPVTRKKKVHQSQDLVTHLFQWDVSR